MKEHDLVMALGRLEGAVNENRRATEDKLGALQTDVKEMKETLKEHDGTIIEWKNDIKWMKKFAGVLGAISAITVTGILKVVDVVWNH